MKKILLPILTLGGLLFAASCQMDEPDAGTLTGEVDFSITAGIPGGISTYADPAGSGSHNGGAVLLDPDEYTLRYTLEVYDRNGKLAYDETKNAPKGTFDGVTFDVRLLAKVYDFVFWADFVKEDGTAFYNVDDLKNITYASTVVSAQELADDAADAYYKKEEVNLTQSSKSLDVTLQRPFGKIRLIATDALNDNNKQDEVPETITIDFGNAAIPTAFNAFEGKVIEGKTANAGTVTFTAQTETTTVNGDEKENVYLLGFHYFFESSAIPSYAMDVTVTSNEDNVIGQRSLSSIPVQENKLTTVIGNFYTNEGSIDVIVEDKFGNEDVKELEDLIFPEEGKVLVTKENGIESTFNTIGEALSNIGSNYAVITLAASDYNETVVIPENANIRIVGQEGTTVNAITAEKGTAVFENIKFDGNQTYNENATVYALGASNLTLLNCVIEPQNSETRAIASIPGFAGTFKLEGCTINSSKGTYFYLNAASESGKIILKNNTFTGKGGSIEIMNAKGDTKKYPVVDGNNFGLLNPSFTYWSDPVITEQSQLDPDTKQYVSEFLSNNTVPAGVKVAPFDGTSFVITSLPLNITNQTTGKKYETIREAVIYAEDGHTIAIEDGTYDMTKLTAIAGKTLTFVGAGENTIFDYSSQAYGEYVNGGSGTFVFKNMTIQRSTATYAGMAHTKSTSYENCTITGTYYVYETTAKFTDCKFDVTGDFYNCWTWGALNATFNRCTFNSDGKAMLLYGTENTNLKIENSVFYDKGGLSDLKAAIEIGNDYDKSYTLVVNNTVVNGYEINDKGINTGTTLWANKNSMGKDKLSVTVDGVKIY